mmetsp:Transcript_25734/g.36700  ORF Transcript_25734/g.36700 Transcript_25734/m.36700 type:complete len:135 (+) Transcript_25734:651-1055(+)
MEGGERGVIQKILGNPGINSLHSHRCNWIILVIYLSPLPTSLYQPYPPLKILSSNKYDLRKSDWKEEIIMSCHHHPLFFCFVISSHYQNHQYSTHLLTPNHPFLPQTSYSSYTSFFYINAHTNSKKNTPKHHSL